MARTTQSVTRPGFVADQPSPNLSTGRTIDWANVPPSYQNDAGDKVITAGTVMSFGADGMLPRDETEATITNITTSSDVATVTTSAAHPYEVGDGVTISETTNYNGTFEITEVADDTHFSFVILGGPADETSGTVVLPASGLLVSSAEEGARQDALSGYGVIVGGVIYGNLLPDFPTETYQTELDDSGVGWSWETYGDDRAS